MAAEASHRLCHPASVPTFMQAELNCLWVVQRLINVCVIDGDGCVTDTCVCTFKRTRACDICNSSLNFSIIAVKCEHRY